MLFYNIQKHCYVVIEIKTRAFDPGDMGQLGTYIATTDGILRADNDNPTIGLLICKTKDNVLAQYATSAVNVPVGISEYELNNLIPDDYKSSMPTIEEIERELKELICRLFRQYLNAYIIQQQDICIYRLPAVFLICIYQLTNYNFFCPALNAIHLPYPSKLVCGFHMLS